MHWNVRELHTEKYDKGGREAERKGNGEGKYGIRAGGRDKSMRLRLIRGGKDGERAKSWEQTEAKRGREERSCNKKEAPKSSAAKA